MNYSTGGFPLFRTSQPWVITDPQATYGYPQEQYFLPQGQQHIPLAYAHPIPMPSSTPYFLAPMFPIPMPIAYSPQPSPLISRQVKHYQRPDLVKDQSSYEDQQTEELSSHSAQPSQPEPELQELPSQEGQIYHDSSVSESKPKTDLGQVSGQVARMATTRMATTRMTTTRTRELASPQIDNLTPISPKQSLELKETPPLLIEEKTVIQKPEMALPIPSTNPALYAQSISQTQKESVGKITIPED